MNNTTALLINEKWSNVAFVGALLCSIIGILVNGITLYVIYCRKSVQSQSITPMITYFTLSNLIFFTFGIPIQAARYHAREWPLPVGMSLLLHNPY